MTPPIRVLWVIKGLGPGGAERLLVAAAAAHDVAQFDIQVAYLLPDKNHLVPELTALGIRCTCLGVRDERDLRWLVSFRRLLKEQRFDIVHLHSPYAAGFARLVARTFTGKRPRLVTTEHNPWSTYRSATRLLNALSAPLDDAVITVSDQARSSLPAGRRRRAVSLPHGVPVAALRRQLQERSSVRTEFDIGATTFVIGTVANYHRKKDWPTLLHAAASVLAQRDSVRFLAVGQGPLESEVVALHHDLGLGADVVLTGYRPDAARLMAGADAFVLASHWEGLPVALMEACALGLPIVASAVGGIPEQFEDETDALLVPAADPDELARALIRLVDDDELRRRLAAASARKADDFDSKRSIEHVESIYRQVLSR